MSLTTEQEAAVRALRIPGLLILALSMLVRALQWGHNGSIDWPPWSWGGAVMFNSGLLATILCYATLPVRRIEFSLLATLSLILEMVMWAHRPASWELDQKLHALGFATGLVATVGIAWRFLASHDAERRYATGLLYLTLISFLFPSVSSYFHRLVVHHAPLCYDGHAYTIDATFGEAPAPRLAQTILDHPILERATYWLYQELALWMVTAVLIGLRYPRRAYPNLMLTLVLMGLGSFLSYTVTPMVGVNLWVGKNWPGGPLPAPGDLTPWAEPDGWWRNCYPSLHMAWTLAIFLGVRRVGPVVRTLFLAGVFLMVPATIYPGCHYFIDLVGSFPYAVAFLAVTATRASGSVRAQTFGLAALLFSLVTVCLRFAPLLVAGHPARLACLLVLAIGGSLALEHRLARGAMPATVTDPPTAPVLAQPLLQSG